MKQGTKPLLRIPMLNQPPASMDHGFESSKEVIAKKFNFVLILFTLYYFDLDIIIQILDIEL